MSRRLKIETQHADDVFTLRFSGDIDEDADFQSVDIPPARQYLFDFKQVTMINSCGIREWINFLRRFDQKSRLAYDSCPQMVVEQMNVVGDFFRYGAEVLSFFAPCYCEACEFETQVLLRVEDVKQGQIPEVACENCKDKMEFDIDEELYFRFLRAS